MNINPSVQTAPATEPITLDELKRQLKINPDNKAEDSALWGFLMAARAEVEAFLGYRLVRQTLEYTVDKFPSVDYLVLPEAAPLVTIDKLDYTNSSDATTTWAASNYDANTRTAPGRLVLKDSVSWPSVTLRPQAGVLVRYTCGQATGDLVHEDIRLQIRMLAGTRWLYRETTGIPEEKPDLSMIAKHRLHSFGAQKETMVA